MALLSVASLRRGTDTSGRAILATDRFWAAWTAVLWHPRIQPFATRVVVVQGAFMALLGGGAEASAGYHNKAGCWDVRTWNLTAAEEQTLWEVAELYGIHFWKRDLSALHGGMDEHGHAITLWDQPLASGAAFQRTQAIAKRDGLAGNRPDYMHRKTPVVLTYPAALIKEAFMGSPDAQTQLAAIKSDTAALRKDLLALADKETARFIKERDRDKAVRTKLYGLLGGLADQLSTTSDPVASTVRSQILSALAEDPDVDGPDNPAAEKL